MTTSAAVEKAHLQGEACVTGCHSFSTRHHQRKVTETREATQVYRKTRGGTQGEGRGEVTSAELQGWGDRRR